MRVDWLSDAEVADELSAVRTLSVSRRRGERPGHFSLPGALPKLALFEENGRWGVPLGRTPTNRILKPPAPNFDAFAENEHICLALASALGVSAAHTSVRSFEGADGVETAIVVDRFDRRKLGASYVRIHQEDCGQALGIAPDSKYENENGPGAGAIFSLIRNVSDAPEVDGARFLDVLALNWVIAGPDAHARNYALLHARGRQVRLAPFYDIASYLPYDAELHKVKLAMKVGGEYLVRRIGALHWAEFARDIGLDEALLLDRIRDLAARIPDAVRDVGREAKSGGLAQSAVGPLVERITKRAVRCEAALR